MSLCRAKEADLRRRRQGQYAYVVKTAQRHAAAKAAAPLRRLRSYGNTGHYKRSDAELAAAWAATPAPKTIRQMAAILGVSFHALKQYLHKHSLTIPKLEALAAPVR